VQGTPAAPEDVPASRPMGKCRLRPAPENRKMDEGAKKVRLPLAPERPVSPLHGASGIVPMEIFFFTAGFSSGQKIPPPRSRRGTAGIRDMPGQTPAVF